MCIKKTGDICNHAWIFSQAFQALIDETSLCYQLQSQNAPKNMGELGDKKNLFFTKREL